jgi:hypothetical protein
MNKNQMEEALIRGDSGKLGIELSIDNGAGFQIMGPDEKDAIASYVCSRGIYHSLLMGRHGWGDSRALISLIKREAVWALSDTEIEYTALFDYRCQRGAELERVEEVVETTQADAAEDIDFDAWYDRYVGAITSYTPAHTVRVTLRGNYSTDGPVTIRERDTYYGQSRRLRSVDAPHDTHFSEMLYDCELAESYSASSGDYVYSVEFLEGIGTLRVPSIEGKTPPIDESYTGWIPSILEDEIISEKKTGLFSIWRLTGTPKAISGNSLYSRVDDYLLHITVLIELTHLGTIYSLPPGVYFVGCKARWKDSVAYDDWLANLSRDLFIKQSTKKSDLLISLGDTSGPSATKAMKKIRPIKDVKDGPAVARRGGSKITKM